MATSAELLERDFGTVSELVAAHAAERPNHLAIIDGERRLTYSDFNALVDRVAASLQRDGLKSRDVIAICAPSSIAYLAAFVGALRAGVAASPLAPTSTARGLALMIRDSGSKTVFLDDSASAALDTVNPKLTVLRIALEGDTNTSFEEWLAPRDGKPQAVTIDPAQAFNIIYSSGTTGTPKGIVQPHVMRWGHAGTVDFNPGGPVEQRRGAWSVAEAGRAVPHHGCHQSIGVNLAHGVIIEFDHEDVARRITDQVIRKSKLS
jgi:acyl-CoA synthetase (AMP-forming)/AMP-acid ligase II